MHGTTTTESEDEMPKVDVCRKCDWFEFKEELYSEGKEIACFCKHPLRNYQTWQLSVEQFEDVSHDIHWSCSVRCVRLMKG